MKKLKASTLLQAAGKLPGIHAARLVVQSWYDMDEEEKIELIQNLMKAGAKAAAK